MEKPYSLSLEIELSKGYDDIEKQTIEITVETFEQASEIWKAVTGVFRQYSKIHPIA